MARLQGVPDALPVPASEQAANSLFGNMVCVDVVQEIFKQNFFPGGCIHVSNVSTHFLILGI
jgi:hypothetical protein